MVNSAIRLDNLARNQVPYPRAQGPFLGLGAKEFLAEVDGNRRLACAGETQIGEKIREGTHAFTWLKQAETPSPSKSIVMYSCRVLRDDR